MGEKKSNMKRKGRYLVLRDGKQSEIIGETGRYYICKDAQYKKGSRLVLRVEEDTTHSELGKKEQDLLEEQQQEEQEN